MQKVLHFKPSDFVSVLKVIAVKVPNKKVSSIRKSLAKYIYIRPKMKVIRPVDNEPDYRYILLNDSIKDTTLSEIPKDIVESIKSDLSDVVKLEVPLNYEFYTAEEILKKILPEGMEIPSAYETVGTLIHLNLRDEQLPWKYDIGQVLLDKTPSVKTVINKTGKIDTVFRTFNMEVLAGEDNTYVELKEEGCIFGFDYAKVYWNSRLQQEHTRLVESLPAKTCILADMFCGVGPFALPAGKRGIRVYANDLNPMSYYYLEENIKRNKLSSKVTPYNMDGRDFIKLLIQEKKQFTDVIMNLPASSELFTDVFSGTFIGWPYSLPTIHCYAFSKEKDPIQDLINRIGVVMGGSIQDHVISTRLVRDVSPKKMMVLITFKVPEYLATKTKDSKEEQEYISKRQKLTENDDSNEDEDD
ncbi:hypothetical protein WA158_000153 [Blastocystis sp. Blastoise]